MADFPLLNEASLVMIPGATKEGKVYSQVPTDGSGDFTFTRSTSATRVNEAGNIEKGYENLLLQSNNFDTTWSTSSTSVTGGQSGYDGSSDAWLFSKSAANGHIRQDINTSGVKTFSIYAKANTNDWIRLRFDNSPSADQNVWINISNGSIGTDTGIATYTTDIGSGWYRLVIQSASTDLANVRIYPANGDNDTAATSGSIYIQDAQINYGLVAYPYLETTTAPVYGGLQSDQPRLDYTDATCPSLLLEPSRTNYIPYTEYLGGLGGDAGLNFNYNNATSPEGLTNAVQVVSNNTGQSYIGYFNGGTTAGDNTFSIFAKYDNCQYICLRASFFTGGETALVWFDIQNGTKGSSTGDSVTYEIEDYGNGWYRCYVVHNVDAGDLSGTGRVYLSDSDGSFNSALNQAAHLYGNQWEAGSYPTSYIPTYGSAQTRGADDAPFPATFNFGTLGDGESGTIVVKTIVNGLTSNNRFNFFSNGGSANWFWNGSTLFTQTTGGSRQFNLGSTASSNLGTEVKLCMRKLGSTLSCFFNGDEKGSIDIGSESIRYCNDFSTHLVSQSIIEFVEFPAALTDTECIALTTI